jgi:hypothetical protein
MPDDASDAVGDQAAGDPLGDPVGAVEVHGHDPAPLLLVDVEVGDRGGDPGERDQRDQLRQLLLQRVHRGDAASRSATSGADARGAHPVPLGDPGGGRRGRVAVDVDQPDVPAGRGEVVGPHSARSRAASPPR